jgi:regulator of protease activity HflC (stomatin/prohibitin superfamily)
VKDLVFPCNLREIMNEVLETERKAEAKLIQARKDAEAQKIKGDAENQALRDRMTAEQERLRMAAQAELERTRLRHEADRMEAKSLQEYPQLLRVRELQTLAEMAKSGGRFVVGLSPSVGLAGAFPEDGTARPQER